jgi:hypothetical protein
LARLNEIGDPSLRDNERLRAEKKARSERATVVAPAHVVGFADAAAAPRAPVPDPASDQGKLHWEAGALARLARVPEGFMRDASRQRVESHARQQGAATVSLDLVESGLAIARAAMSEEMAADGGGAAAPKTRQGKCPFSRMANPPPAEVTPAPDPAPALAPAWTAEAAARLQAVPEGFCRTLTERAVNSLAGQNGKPQVDIEFVEGVLRTFESGSRTVATRMPWGESARERIERAPEVVRGMLVKEIEGWAKRNGLEEVDEGAVNAVKLEWQAQGVFHLDPGDPRRGA